MKIVIQRVCFAEVAVDNLVVGKIGQGLLLLVGFGQDDGENELGKTADKILNLRIFVDDDSKFNYSVLDIKGEILLVPQFTLLADISKGRRPDFTKSLHPKKANILFEKFVQIFRKSGLNVQTGEFGASMQVSLQNDGPVTIIVEK